MSACCRVHRFDLKMTAAQARLEQLRDHRHLPKVTRGFLWIDRVDFVVIVEKIT